MNAVRLCCVFAFGLAYATSAECADKPAKEELAKDVADYSKECRKRVEKGESLSENYTRLALGRLAEGDLAGASRYFSRAYEKLGGYGPLADLLVPRWIDRQGSRAAYALYLADIKENRVAEFYLAMAIDGNADLAARGKKVLADLGAAAVPTLFAALRLPSFYLDRKRLPVIKDLLARNKVATLDYATDYARRLEREADLLDRQMKAAVRDGLRVSRSEAVCGAYLAAQRVHVADVIGKVKSKK